MLNRRFILFHFLFWGAHIGIFVFGYFKQKNDFELRILNSLGKSVFISRGAGLVLSVDCAMLLFGVCRNTITFLRQSWLNKWIPFEENLYFHRWTAYSMLLFSIIHTNAHYTNMFLVQYQAPQLGLGTAFQIHYQQFAGITGHIMLFICFLMYTSAKLQVKIKNYELFWYTHHLFVPFYICLFLHAKGCFVKSYDNGQCKGYDSNLGTVPFFLLYIAERTYRHYRASLSTKLTKVIFHPGNTMEIRFEKDSLRYNPGQYLFLNIPSVSAFQWHPFTISSTPEEGFISVHIRIVGDWTRQAAEIMGCFHGKGNSPRTIRIHVDGPYGSPTEDLYNYKVALLIGAGIGVTPAASLLKSVWYRYYRNAPMPLKKLYFFWLNRDAESFSWFQSLIASLEDSVLETQLEIHTYLTGRQSLDDIHHIALSIEDAVDPITELKSRTHYGRPNWRSIFKAIQVSEASQKDKGDPDALEVGVFYCGPAALAKVLGNECMHATDDSIKFILRKERF